MGNRVGLTVGSDEYSFVYNPVAGVPAVIVESGPDKTCYYYFRDPNGVLIARFDTYPQNEDPWRYYHYDELGSTRLLTDSDGDVTDEYAYDAYGNTITHVGTTEDNPYQWVGALGYYTHYQAPEFKLIQLGFRSYDPETGRFTQQDPIRDGLNWYGYASGNPVGAVDPWGLMAWYDHLLFGASDMFAGWSDALTFGGTGRVRLWMGTNDVLDERGGWYKAGAWIGVVHTIAFGAAGGAKAAGTKCAGREFSHFWPKRWGGPRSIFNGNWVTPKRHYLHDPFRYPSGCRNWGAKWPAPIAQLDRIPKLFKGIGIGAGVGLGRKHWHDARHDCPCEQ